MYVPSNNAMCMCQASFPYLLKDSGSGLISQVRSSPLSLIRNTYELPPVGGINGIPIVNEGCRELGKYTTNDPSKGLSITASIVTRYSLFDLDDSESNCSLNYG